MMLLRLNGRYDVLLAFLVLTVGKFFNGTLSLITLVSNGRSCIKLDVGSTLAYRDVCSMSLLNS